MSSSPPEHPQQYRVEMSEPAEQEADSIYLWISETYGPEQAGRWYSGLLDAIQRLSLFPYGYQALPQNKEVRRMLYGQYRVLYRVVEPEPGELEGTVRILRILHGARQPDLP